MTQRGHVYNDRQMKFQENENLLKMTAEGKHHVLGAEELEILEEQQAAEIQKKKYRSQVKSKSARLFDGFLNIQEMVSMVHDACQAQNSMSERGKSLGGDRQLEIRHLKVSARRAPTRKIDLKPKSPPPELIPHPPSEGSPSGDLRPGTREVTPSGLIEALPPDERRKLRSIGFEFGLYETVITDLEGKSEKIEPPEGRLPYLSLATPCEYVPGPPKPPKKPQPPPERRNIVKNFVKAASKGARFSRHKSSIQRIADKIADFEVETKEETGRSLVETPRSYIAKSLMELSHKNLKQCHNPKRGLLANTKNMDRFAPEQRQAAAMTLRASNKMRLKQVRDRRQSLTPRCPGAAPKLDMGLVSQAKGQGAATARF
eukprot:TRINITY_DN3562_c0_g2_i1.p1 TRINITY_DN3562_c0_g2~~TRINITY_DN3562_c0_g2_i1.p1  ORF type:complete len:373 (+),score=98.88 TRINITY_DN3562_c0_g2_i1:193-1311(+)